MIFIREDEFQKRSGLIKSYCSPLGRAFTGTASSQFKKKADLLVYATG